RSQLKETSLTHSDGLASAVTVAPFDGGPEPEEEIAMVPDPKRFGPSVLRLLAVVLLLGLGSIARPASARDKRTLVVDGVTRSFYVDPGKDAATTPSPLVFVFHGYGGSWSRVTAYGIARAWPEATVVYPQGVKYYGSYG